MNRIQSRPGQPTWSVAHRPRKCVAWGTPTTDDGGPARMLGRVYQETPGGLLLGSKPEAIKWYKKSIEVAPNAVSTRLWLGETYVAAGQPGLARPELKRVAEIKPRGGHEKEESDYRQKAEALIKKLPAE